MTGCSMPARKRCLTVTAAAFPINTVWIRSLHSAVHAVRSLPLHLAVTLPYLNHIVSSILLLLTGMVRIVRMWIERLGRAAYDESKKQAF